MAPVLEMKRLTKQFGSAKVIDEISLSLPKSGFVGLIGLNGSGKTTLLHLMSGLMKPTSGTIKLDGHQVTRQSGSQIAYVAEGQSFYGYYTVKEIIDYADKVYPDFVRSEAEEIIQYLEFDLSKKISQLSKGNKMRLNIAIVLARNVPLILMDEPLSGLDQLVREEILKLFVIFGGEKERTIVISSHEVSEIEPYLDYAIFLKEGKLMLFSSVEEIREERKQSVLNVMREYCI